MKSTKPIKNFVFQFLYQIIILILPLVTAPYLTRVLGSDNLGIYVYTYSIASYFVVLAMLGIARHGQRVIVQNIDNKVKLRKTFWSLFVLHIGVSLLATIIYFIFCFFQKNSLIVYYLQGIYVLSAIFDITWLFYGLENFKSVVIKNLIVRIIETACIFLFVRTTSDLTIYTLIMVISALVGQAILLPQAIRILPPIKFGYEDIKVHIKPLLVLSITIIAVNLYTLLDKTLIGMFISKADVAYYEYADKIIKIPKTIIGVVGTVMFPRCCASFFINDIKSVKKYLTTSFHFAYFIGFGSLFGLLAISDLFTIIYYGNSFFETSFLIKIMAPLILIISLGDILRTQILIPNHKDLQYTLCILISSILNIICSTVLLFAIGVAGAIYGTLIAETISLICQLIICRKYLDFHNIIKNLFPYAISGALMFIVISLIKVEFNKSVGDLIMQISIGALVYILCLALYLIIFQKRFISKIIEKISNIFHYKE